MCAVLIVYTDETQDWATYLKLILESSRKFAEGSITFYNAEEESSSQEDYSLFSSSKCIVLLISVAFVDVYNEPGLRYKFERLLQPPYKVVAFLCGVSESDGLMDFFKHWDSWRKLDSDDEPSVYVSTVMEVIAEENVRDDLEDQLEHDYGIPPVEENDYVDAPEKVAEELDVPPELPPLDEYPQLSDENLSEARLSPPPLLDEKICLTVQPNRILCGSDVDVYIIMVNKLDSQASMEVEFRCEQSTKRVQGTLVNEYIVSAQSPDMPVGDVTLDLYTDESLVCSTTVTYYTEMEEISSYLEKVMDPVQFMCQAFNISSKMSEDLDNLFTDSLKKRMPANGLQVFGVSQLEQDNTLENERNTELPTLLHFSAKYGLKKLTSMLLQCPGALQAYSVANRDGDYPNTLAEKSGFSDLRQFMDDYVETVDLVKSHIEDSVGGTEGEDVYEPMTKVSQNFVAKYSLQEDIYESMMELNPGMQLYEDLDSVLNESQNPEEEMLRKFFEAKSEESSETLEDPENSANQDFPDISGDYTEDDSLDIYSMEEDPYKLCTPDDIYDTVDEQENTASVIMNRPPAPVPRPSMAISEPDEHKTYISSVFGSKDLYSMGSSNNRKTSNASVMPENEPALSSEHDNYASMKTPGQQQLIALQERVKVGALTVEEAVQEFKDWKLDQEKRSQSIRFQQENLQKLRNSITRRHKEKGRNGKMEELEITAPIQRNIQWGSRVNIECSVYEPSPRTSAQPPSGGRPPQRGTWQTGSTSSTSSSSSNRYSTQSTLSYSSGAEIELEEPQENVPPPRPPRPAVEGPPMLPPPRLPRRQPDRFTDSMLHDRYVSAPARGFHQPPPQRPIPPPPVPRRPW